ncbi:Peptidase A1 domain-containing protein [Caenorhabditis elegans]|uniref:Peptidase A1 domain-containing protein n=1 Tax=Caenorhabditis elegans TaxID=6239 RepID=Q7JKL9_CAEEL|nr:Peptidase A1 domain-containing protein [Caenorhabditis elegans]CAB05013.2 Peptidase A1 domain-containing protein [Caenorhabditis elegans]|eukprot:NP_507653.2 ASpartyl Protease [Caenorhabditis elegans]
MNLLLLLVTTCSAAVFQVPTTTSGSFRAKLIREGKYSSFLASRLQQLNTGSQPLLGFSDDPCIGNITIGSPPQSAFVFMDTTSANLWVMGSACTSVNCNDPLLGIIKHKFNTTKSTSFVKSNRKFNIQYGSGECSGYLGTDTVEIGGLKIQKQEFGVANIVDYDFGTRPIDGIFGLAWPALSVDQVTPPMQNLVSQNQLDAPIFTIFFDKRDPDYYYPSNGLITYGGLDTKNCNANISYVPVSSKTYWQFKVDGFQVGTYNRTVNRDQAIMDTGSSWFGLPYSVIAGIATQTNATWDLYASVYTVPCSTMNSLPDLVFTIGAEKFPISAPEYVEDVGLDDGTCALAMYGIDASGFGPSVTLGNIFIRRYCSVFDVGNARIGFADAIHPNSVI